MSTNKTKTIVITGASSGLGAGMARMFAARGYQLGLCARRIDRLESLRDELTQAHGVRVELLALDVNDHAQVFEVFKEFHQRFGHISRLVINAGLGDGRRLGTGHFELNRKTAETNYIAALAQVEAAMEIFRAQKSGHLVLISSMSAMRGLPRHLTNYAATKAALAHLGEGLRAELRGSPIKVSTIFPGYIRTEMNKGAKKLPFEVDEKTGSCALANAIEREPDTACVPGFPWTLVGFLMRNLPLGLVVKLNG